jgi:hypothetical protein
MTAPLPAGCRLASGFQTFRPSARNGDVRPKAAVRHSRRKGRLRGEPTVRHRVLDEPLRRFR